MNQQRIMAERIIDKYNDQKQSVSEEQANQVFQIARAFGLEDKFEYPTWMGINTNVLKSIGAGLEPTGLYDPEYVGERGATSKILGGVSNLASFGLGYGLAGKAIKGAKWASGLSQAGRVGTQSAMASAGQDIIKDPLGAPGRAVAGGLLGYGIGAAAPYAPQVGGAVGRGAGYARDMGRDVWSQARNIDRQDIMNAIANLRGQAQQGAKAVAGRARSEWNKVNVFGGANTPPNVNTYI